MQKNTIKYSRRSKGILVNSCLQESSETHMKKYCILHAYSSYALRQLVELSVVSTRSTTA